MVTIFNCLVITEDLQFFFKDWTRLGLRVGLAVFMLVTTVGQP